MAQYVTTHEATQQRYVLLQPGTYPARTGDNFQIQADWRDLDWITKSAAESKYLAVDFETKGGDYSDEICIVGIGLAWDSGSAYFDWDSLFSSSRTRLVTLLESHAGLLAHNVYFDGGVARQCLSPTIKFNTCTYSLLAHLANEGHPDQYWGLKSAMTELLGWESSNETDLDEWLVVNGYYIGNRRLDNSPEHLRSEFQLGKLRADKGEMWRAPRDILGKYCVLDAEACYLLYTQVLEPVLSNFPGLRECLVDNMHLINLLIEQKICGIPVDRAGLLARKDFLRKQMVELEQKFRDHPDTEEQIYAMETAMVSELQAKEPDKLKKNGEVSKNWIKWKQRIDSAHACLLPEYRFNIQSGPQLRELLYTRLGAEIRVRTETGDAGVGVKALKHMGDIGQIVIDRAYALKELGYIEDYLARTETRATIHPSFRTPGTMTGRLSSKEPNIQQIPKSKAVMSLFTARPGHVWIDLDFAALEPVVLTEFSQDEALLSIYGNGRPKNDIYLYVAANIPAYATEIQRTGYDPQNPTPAALAEAKASCKSIRSICKTVVLACQYGAGVNKIMQTLEQDDVFLSFEEVSEIHQGYWNTFAGVRDFSKKLWYEWRKNGGWILNGMGRPMCIPEHMTKDILNRFVQSTGHDILAKYVSIYVPEIRRRRIPWNPVIADWHDASAGETPIPYKDDVVEIMLWGVDKLNEHLRGTIKLRGEPDVGYNLADIKRPEE